MNTSVTINWRKELENWAVAEAASGNSPIVDRQAVTVPKMSNFLRFVRLAKETPDVWNALSELDNALAEGRILQRDIDEGNSDYAFEVVGICSEFASWFRMKNAITNDERITWAVSFLVLKEFARQKGHMTDSAIAAEFLKHTASIDIDVDEIG